MSEEDSVRSYHDTESVVGDVECRLTEQEAEERGDWVEEELLPHLEAVEEHEDGFSFVLEKSDEALETVVAVIVLESRCCADEGFALELPYETDEIRLRVYGPDGTKELAREGFFEKFEGIPEPTR